MGTLYQNKIKLIKKYGDLKINDKEIVFKSSLVSNLNNTYISQTRSINTKEDIINHIYKYLQRKLGVNVL